MSVGVAASGMTLGGVEVCRGESADENEEGVLSMILDPSRRFELGTLYFTVVCFIC
ncbi:hypothetical protein [Trueperella sp. LYQ143]|uniref:hypothetical protein n=1 Tax=unclassified Trueperella TaxID=2630174 RepID=UPI003982D8CF